MFQQYFIDVLTRHYADFDGRARRQEFWMFVLFNTVFVTMMCIVAVVGFAIAEPLGYVLILVLLAYNVGVIVPGIAVGVRRLHDIGKPGIWYLIIFVPFVGSFIFLYFCVLDSQPGPNAFGPNPKEG